MITSLHNLYIARNKLDMTNNNSTHTDAAVLASIMRQNADMRGGQEIIVRLFLIS